MPPTAIVALTVHLLLMIGGGIVLWRIALSPAARRQRPEPQLAPWIVRSSDFLLFLWLVILGAIAGAYLGRLLAAPLESFVGSDKEARILVMGFGSQLGMLAACIWLRFLRGSPAGAANHPPRTANSLLQGGLIFLAILPLVTVVGLAWQAVLQSVGLPVKPQDLIQVLAETDSPGLLAAFVVFATIVAPMTEELVFRAGLFRFFRTRVPRIVALLGPALLFASLHINWSTLESFGVFGPLVALGVIFSLAYERTGSIAVPIVAHGLFNLNTVALVLAGVPADF